MTKTTCYYFLDTYFLSSKKSLHYCLSVSFNVYLFILFFDIMRDALPFLSIVNVLVSGIRDISLYLTGIYILTTKKSAVLGLKSIYILGYVLVPLFMWFANSLDGTNGERQLGVVIQFCILASKVWIFLYVLQNLNLFYVFDKSKICKNFVSISVFMLLFSLLVYFFFPGIIIKYTIENRIGLGNMSIQSGVYCCAYILCIYFFPYKKKLTNYLMLFLLFAGILISVCSTGIISVLLITIAFVFEKQTRKRSLVVLTFVALVCTIIVIKYFDVLFSFFDYFWMKAEQVFDLVGNLFAEKKHTTKSASFHARELQIKNVMENHNDLIDRFFGHGFFSITDKSIFIENTYYALYFDCGIYGIIVLVLIIFSILKKSLILFFRKKSFLGIVSLISFLFFMTTLDISIIPGLSSAFAILFYIIFMDKSYLRENSK